MKTRHTLAFLALSSLLTAGPTFGQAWFHGVGDLPGGDVASNVDGVSTDGSIAVGEGFSHLGYEAFRWTVQTGIVGLGHLPGGHFSIAAGISADGSVIVGEADDELHIRAVRWTEQAGWAILGHIPGGGAFNRARAVTPSGEVIVGKGQGPVFGEAFRWTAQTKMVGLGVLPGGDRSEAWAVSASGSVIVGDGTSDLAPGGYGEPFRWTSVDGMQGLGLLPGYSSGGAWAISADGSVIVGTCNRPGGDHEAFRWTEESGMVGLGDLDGGLFYSMAIAVTADGSVVAGLSHGPDGVEAVLWLPDLGMVRLRDVLLDAGLSEVADWKLVAAWITPDGDIVHGHGINPDGAAEGFVAHLGPLCDVDLDGNRFLDLFDFLAFINLFNANDPAADCEDDDVFDLFDFLCFQDLFLDGC